MLGPVVPGVGLEVERSELVIAHDDVRIARGRLGLSAGEVVELENPVLLRSTVGVVRLLPGLQRLTGDTLLVEERPESLVADGLDHPLSHQVVGQPGERPSGKRFAVVGRTTEGDLSDRLVRGTVNFGGRPPEYLGASESKSSLLKLWMTSRTRSCEVKAILARAGRPCAGRSAARSGLVATARPTPILFGRSRGASCPPRWRSLSLRRARPCLTLRDVRVSGERAPRTLPVTARPAASLCP